MRPRSVVIAITLQSIALVFASVTAVLNVEFPTSSTSNPIPLLAMLGSMAFSAVLIALAYLGRSWARNAIAIFFVWGVAFAPYDTYRDAEILTIVCWIGSTTWSLAGVILLFLPSSNRWFREQNLPKGEVQWLVAGVFSIYAIWFFGNFIYHFFFGEMAVSFAVSSGFMALLSLVFYRRGVRARNPEAPPEVFPLTPSGEECLASYRDGDSSLFASSPRFRRSCHGCGRVNLVDAARAGPCCSSCGRPI